VEGEDALLRLYQEHSVFLTPSVFEGQLLTMQEAAAAGLAIVGTSCCGMRDFLRDGITGLLVEPGDVDGLTAAINRLVENPDLAARIGSAAQADSRRFTWKRSSEQFLSAVAAAVGCRPRARQCAF
jgi:glycosyltransferase involved in cell wall biosynthesis